MSNPIGNRRSAIGDPVHFVSLAQTGDEVLGRVFELAFDLREERRLGRAHRPILAGRTLAMLFEKPSLRTRVSFEQAMYELGGRAIVLTGAEVGLGKREAVGDVARVLSGMVHGIMARVFEHEKLLELAAHSAVPVINALSDYSHPCQALADVMTMMDEFCPGGRDPRKLAGRTLTFVGDGNNVARSLAVACGRFGMEFILSAPPGYELPEADVQRLRSQVPGLSYRLIVEPREAVRRADVIYTDTWVSMGQEAEASERKRVFGGYQIDEGLVAAAPGHAIVLHCLPAYRNVEIRDAVIDGPRSRVFEEAHNRLHLQKGLLAVLMGG